MKQMLSFWKEQLRVLKQFRYTFVNQLIFLQMRFWKEVHGPHSYPMSIRSHRCNKLSKHNFFKHFFQWKFGLEKVFVIQKIWKKFDEIGLSYTTIYCLQYDFSLPVSLHLKKLIWILCILCFFTLHLVKIGSVFLKINTLSLKTWLQHL